MILDASQPRLRRSSHLGWLLLACLPLGACGGAGGSSGDSAPPVSAFPNGGAGGAASTQAGPANAAANATGTGVGAVGQGGTGAAGNSSSEAPLPVTGLNGSSGASSATGSAGSTAGTGAGSGGSGGTSAAGGAGGSTVGTGGFARVGAELCPAGPFGSPLPANPSVQVLAAVGDNNFFNWEGLVWDGQALYFSEIANGNASQLNRYTPGGAVERGVIPNTGSNGLALDADGNLVAAAHDVGGISRIQLPNGPVTRGTQKFNGMRFNSPNDLVLRGDGSIYFTDPDFQSPSGRIQPTRVYHIAPDDGSGSPAITVVEDTIDQPNGITLSPDGNTLYVSGGSVLRSYSLDAAGTATKIGDFQQQLEVPDGMAMDCAGNIYAIENSAKRIRVFSPAGQLLGTIGPAGFTGQAITNLAFGGPNRTTLFVSGFTQAQQPGLYSVELNVPGFPY